MTFSDRPGARTDSVLNKGINALIGAVYCDSKCVKTTFEVLIYLSWFSLTIYPNEISEPAGSQHPNVQQNMTNEPNPRHPDAEDGLEELENEVDPYDEALRAYLSEEQQRCSFHDYCPPRDTYYNAGIERRLCDLEKKTTVHLRMLFLLIAGPHSFVGLKAKVHHVFTSRDVPTGTYTTILSPPERYEVIRQLDQRIIHFEMIRNYHILLLFKECGGSESSYNLTAEHFHTNTRSSGNPFNARESEITKRMIDRVCPTADSSKFEEFKGLRRMGKRLHTLERMFGTGVLGLMHSHEVAGIKAVGLSHLL